ncbi:hypothetical protein [Acetobacter sp. DsW_063]|uniref:hypothetical protein n=1 Tax=Acetobacter sp. DsW_063 TaxID=1514894 RepID=UPI000A3BB068|nr:hypothetical protein [Acetobacter sp. DsW_063]OUJ16497.1 hypothetical protein HK28_12540 [Acetobacter sp. DsW_063]
MADIYKIGVTIAMKDNASAVLQTLGKHVLGLNMSVDQLQGKFNRLHVAAAGFMGVLVGGAMVRGLDNLSKAGAELQKQQTAMKIAGMSHVEIMNETARAYKSMSEVRGPDIADRLHALLELRSIIGAGKSGHDYGEINATLPAFLKTRALYGDEGSKDIFRVVEQMGGARFSADGSFDDARFNKYLDATVKTLQASVGTIKPSDLKNAMQMASVTARGMDPDAFWNMMMTPIIEMGGYRAGTAVTAMSRAFYGGVMPQRNAEEMSRLGIIHGIHQISQSEMDALHLPDHLSRDDRKRLSSQGYRFGADGRVIMSRGSLAGDAVLNDPSQGIFPWIRDYVAPNLRSDYQKNIASRPGNTESFDAYVRDEIYKLLPTETARRFGALIVQQITSIERDQTLRTQSKGISAYDDSQQNYETQLKNLQASWKSFTQTIGLPAAQDAAHILREIGGGLDKLTQAASAHPDAAKNFIRVAEAGAVLFTVGGTLSIAAVALGPFAKGIRLFARVMTSEAVASSVPAMATFGTSALALSKRLLLASAKLGVVGVVSDQVVRAVDPGDHAGAWVDRHIPGASWLDNQASRIGLGRSYDEQRRVEEQIHPTRPQPIQVNLNVDGKKIADVLFDVEYGRAMSDLRAQGSYADGVGNPRMPGMAFGN